MIETLYGVMHGKSVNLGPLRVKEIYISPSRDLLRDLESLQPGSKVGIEFYPDYQGTFEIQGKQVVLSEACRYYWESIIRQCNDLNLAVVYLDDFEAIKREAEIKLELNALDEMLQSQPENFDSYFIILQKIYALEVWAEYLFIIDREEKMFDRIVEEQPNMVILGRDHIVPLLLDPDPLVRRGLTVKEQKTEIVSEFFLGRDAPFIEVATIVQQQIPDKNIMIERELLKRRYRAVREGRVIEGRTPDYIGTWSPKVPARGLFEMYVNENGSNGFSGTIEDCLGTSNFHGELVENEMLFSKEYDPESAGNGASPDLVQYRGDFMNVDFVKGHYRSPLVGKGRFHLRKFNGTPFDVNTRIKFAFEE